MRLRRTWFAILAIMIVLFAFGWSSPAQKQNSSKTAWEYKEISGGEYQINQLGAQGWELVSVVYDQGAGARIYTLKRAK
jgi:hypothetical protein